MVAIPGIQTTLIDHGFYQISARDAKRLCDGILPREGYEKLVVVHGAHYWVTRTLHHGTMVWSIRCSNGWRLIDGIATL